MINPITFLKRPFIRMKIADLNIDLERLQFEALNARKMHRPIKDRQRDLTAVRNEIMRLEATL